MKINEYGKLFVITAPSGAGKDETLKYFKNLGCVEIRTGTMRAPRSNSADDGALVFLKPDISIEELRNKGFNYASTQYGNQYYVSHSEIIHNIHRGQDSVMIMSKQATIDSLKNNPFIRENMSHIFIYRDGLTLDFLKDLNSRRKSRVLTIQEEIEVEHRYERAKYLFTRVNEGEGFDRVILNVGNLDFLRNQVNNIYYCSKKTEEENKKPRVFCIMGMDKEDVSQMMYLTRNRLLSHGIEVISRDKCTISNIRDHLENSRDVMLSVNDFNEIHLIKENFPDVSVKSGFLFSDNASDYAHNRLLEYADNIADIDFTALVSLPFMHRDDVFENMVFYKMKRSSISVNRYYSPEDLQLEQLNL